MSNPTNPSLARTAPLLFVSGFCALVYQTVWLRELRLVFGASSPASAAVLAIFMAGLGVGSALLGRRADRHPRPLALYGNLELLVAASAAVTPLLVAAVRAAYVALGGTTGLGLTLGTVVRLVLSALVLALPTIAMGGTMPAAARAVETSDDSARRSVAVLYGVNALGAVVGAAASTFVLLEVLGVRDTLFCAALLNGLVALVARGLARREAPVVRKEEAAPGGPVRPLPRFVLLAAALVGFVFFLLELVWYRMLGPLLGGSTYTFGLILALGLGGIGAGGLLYALRGRGRPSTLGGFAATCAAEALFVALPLAMGDRLALFAHALRPLGALGMGGLVFGWALVAAIVVLPVGIVAGYQFPLLIGLLGDGDEAVGRQVGSAYAWNTAGSIVGSLAGGFGVLPLLGAPGTWRFSAVLLAALAAGAVVLAWRGAGRARPLVPIALAALSLLLLFAEGPTAGWRHGGIGAGRAGLQLRTSNGVREWIRSQNRDVAWEADGVESSVALRRADGLSFIVNGKSDGNAIGDAGTQVMAGLVGAALETAPRRALVIGLGTGSTAGWLAQVPTMERVDVVEIEPAILEVARRCAAVNRNVLENPKVHVLMGDAREVLLSTRERYDIVFSEPSNPYRAGIASLFTQEFYEAAKERLAPGGLFLQWLQTYEVDARTVRTVFATLASRFEHVETWHTLNADLLLVAGREPPTWDGAALRARLASEPFRSAQRGAWLSEGIEGFLAHRIGGDGLARALAADAAPSTDDHPDIEFAFARTVGVRGLFGLGDVVQLSLQLHTEALPPALGLDEQKLEAERRETFPGWGRPTRGPQARELQSRLEIFRLAADGQWQEAGTALAEHPFDPQTWRELVVIAELHALVGADAALPLIDRVREGSPVDADLLLAAYAHAHGDTARAADLLEKGTLAHRTDPWGAPSLFHSALDRMLRLGRKDPALAHRFFAALEKPFAAFAYEEGRLTTRVALAKALGDTTACVAAFTEAEPGTWWDRSLLQDRAACYRAAGHPLAERAEEELALFVSNETVPLTEQIPVAEQAPLVEANDL